MGGEGATERAAAPRTAVLGLGRAGRDLLHLLVASGQPPALAWRRGDGPATVAGVAVTGGALPGRIDAELIVLAVPDGAIGELAAALARQVRLSRGTAVAHLSGATPAAVLRRAGLDRPCASMHPLQTLVGDGRAHAPFPWILEGEPDAVDRAEALVLALGCEAVPLDAGGKARYHTAATMVSNHLVALTHAAHRQFRRAGLPADRLPALFIPLMETALDHVARQGPSAALTGPVLRGDVETVAGHLRELADSPADRDAYRSLSVLLLEIAAQRGTPPAQHGMV